MTRPFGLRDQARQEALELLSRIVFEAARECGPAADIATIEAKASERIAALPADQRQAVEDAMKALAAYRPPGFHEHGPH